MMIRFRVNLPMKNQTIFLILLSGSILLGACQGLTGLPVVKQQTRRVDQGDTLVYDLGSFGDEEGARVILDPDHATFSQTRRLFPGSEMVYEYVPESGFTGEDYVEIETNRGSDGASRGDDIEIIELTIIVRD